MPETDDRIHFRCPSCDRKLRVAAKHAGSRVRCPRCDAELIVPGGISKSKKRRPHLPAENTVTLSDLYPPAKAPDSEHWIDMTAMVDIVFFLLIFFMVTSFNSQQASIELPIPDIQAEGGKGSRPQSAMERFEADGNCIIVRIDGDDSVWLEDQEMPAIVELPQQIRDVAAKRSANSAKPNYVLVLASGDAQHGTAVNVLDAAREAGITDLRLAVEDVE